MTRPVPDGLASAGLSTAPPVTTVATEARAASADRDEGMVLPFEGAGASRTGWVTGAHGRTRSGGPAGPTTCRGGSRPRRGFRLGGGTDSGGRAGRVRGGDEYACAR